MISQDILEATVVSKPSRTFGRNSVQMAFFSEDGNPIDVGSSGGGGAVDSVNGKTGTVILNSDDLNDGSSKVQMLSTERAKLSSIATNATANSTDAQLRDRSTHTGEQAQSTVTGLVTALAAKLDKVFARTASDSSPSWRTNFTGSLSTSVQNIVEHWINGVRTAGDNEWGGLRGWSIPYPDALVRAIRADGDGLGSGTAPCFHINERRTGQSVIHIYARTYAGQLIRNDINLSDTYIREAGDNTIPAELPANTLVVTKGA